MAFRKRTRFRKKRRTSRRIPRKRSFRKRSFKRKGFVKNYKKVGFVGRRTVPYKKFFRELLVRRYATYNAGQISFTGAALTSDRCYAYMPMGNMTQGSVQATGIGLGYSQFTGINMWLRGISHRIYIAPTICTDMYYRVMVFWVHQDFVIWNAINGVIGAYTSCASIGNTVANKEPTDAFQFLDVPYGIAGGYLNVLNQERRPNPNYPGSVLYDRKFKVTATAGAVNAAESNGGNPTKVIDIYLPFNKSFLWSTVPSSSDNITGSGGIITDLTATPNFGKHGQPLFLIYALSGTEMGNPGSMTATTFGISSSTMVYFKDIDA